ncbi:MAG TPA: hypothetical protein VJR48_02535 [Ktedonobacterales bacterium]|nr:hypothetical protein [Ktedonobacterales bacterium]
MASDYFTGYWLTGVLLILALILFAIGAGLPFVCGKRNNAIYMLTSSDNLSAVAANLTICRWANIFMGAAVVMLLAGLTLLTALLEAKEWVFSSLGFAGFLLAAVLWLIFSTFRGMVTVRVAQDMAAAGTSTRGAAPAYYAPLAQWMFALFFIYAILGFLALAAYGLSLLQAGLLPAWVGWATILFSIAMLIVLFIKGDNLPILHYLPGLLVGALLLFHR